MPRGGGSLHLKAIPKGDHVYYHLATSFRDGGRVRTRYLHHFGALTSDQADQVRAWLEDLRTHPWTSPPPPAPTELPPLEFVDNLPSFRLGVPALGHALFQALGLRALLNHAFAGIGRKGRHIDLTEVMVLNRLDDPKSKLALRWGWYPRTALPHLLGLPETGWDEDDLYETLDAIDERRDRIERAVYEKIVRPLEEGAPEVLLKDLTSSYFEGSGVANPLSEKGYSRDRIRGSRQVNWSLVLTPKGFPVTLEVYPGNTKDETTVAGTVERVQKVFGLKAGTFVGDRGMLTKKNLGVLTAAKFHYVIAETLWNVKEVLAEAEKKERAPLEADEATKSGRRKGIQTSLEVGLSRATRRRQRGPEESWCEVVGEDGRRHLCLWSEA